MHITKNWIDHTIDLISRPANRISDTLGDRISLYHTGTIGTELHI